MLRIFRRDVEGAVPYGSGLFVYHDTRTMPDPTHNLPFPDAPITVWLHALRGSQKIQYTFCAKCAILLSACAGQGSSGQNTKEIRER